MERMSDRAIEIINDLHTERLDYESEYLPLIDCANKCASYEDTGLEPQLVQMLADAIRGKTGVFCPVCGDGLELEDGENGLMIGCFGCGEYVPVKRLFEVYREQAESALKAREKE